ncbi:hypothetical protein P261_01305 [Lachnospiraceae bacterium TWA4]|nr:hypothetical protein P261_01305 [Lachnospiraceae bacterium TWA4]
MRKQLLGIILSVGLFAGSLTGCTKGNQDVSRETSIKTEQAGESVSRETSSETITKSSTATNETTVEETTVEETLPPLPQGQMYAWVSTKGRLNVRREAKTDASLIGHIKYRQRVVIEGEPKKEGFYPITATDCMTKKEIKGFASVDFFTFEQPKSAKVQLDVPAYLQTDDRWEKSL